MGKLHSKHAAVCKPRESPEGDSFVVNACLARKGIDDWIVKQKYYCTGSRLEQQDCQHKSNCRLSSRDSSNEVCGEGFSDEHYRLEVALPPEKTDSCCAEGKMQERESQAPGVAQKQLKFEELECAVSVEEDNRQEWTFTLYDFDNNGKVTREDITSLLHTIYEVVDASVNHSPSTSKTLRVKLSVAADSNHWRTSLQSAADTPHSRQKADKWIEDPKSSDKKSRALLRRHYNDHHTQQGCQRHCVDENLERRNHYLDLAGVENYTSRFGSGTTAEPVKAEHQIRAVNQARSRSHEPENGHTYHHRRSQAIDIVGHCPPTLDALCPRSHDEAWGKHVLRSPKAHGRTLPSHSASRAMRTRGAPPPPALLSHNAAHQSSGPYRRHKQRPKEGQAVHRASASHGVPGTVLEKEQVQDLPSMLLHEGGLAHVVQRHQHHHHHEHHHHYHHFYQS